MESSGTGSAEQGRNRGCPSLSHPFSLASVDEIVRCDVLKNSDEEARSWVIVPVLVLSSRVILGTTSGVPKPQFSHLLTGL